MIVIPRAWFRIQNNFYDAMHVSPHASSNIRKDTMSSWSWSRFPTWKKIMPILDLDARHFCNTPNPTAGQPSAQS
ncbi:unnamed protein product [Allacma fusca]|uniref:Uncharacterized protein n=1 Tax=Allacma fusca TaxID=39272 RepID=A0A8J2P1U5_9HEXA|nr:unnamed protein product [Allacma fusca]